MRCAVIGGVNSTSVLVEALSQNGFKDVKVWGFTPPVTKNISGWCDLENVAKQHNYPFTGFNKVTECSEGLLNYKPDVLFVVGLSQIIPKEMLEIAKILNVGFHPTALPKGRGRAAIAWMIIKQISGAATFFEIQEGVDDGPIIAQEPFKVREDDYAFDVEEKVLLAEKRALDRWLPSLKSGKFKLTPQKHCEASWLGKRAPEDGWLDWSKTSPEILALIRASSKPHPGAYTFHDDTKIIVWKASVHLRNESGVEGRILKVNQDRTFVVQSGDGLILVESWEAEGAWCPRVGVKLGFIVELENYELKKKLKELDKRLALLEKRCQDDGVLSDEG